MSDKEKTCENLGITFIVVGEEREPLMNEQQTQILDEPFEAFVRRSFAEMNERLARLEARAYETKPIWEQALAEILEVKQTVETIDYKLNVLNKEFLEMKGNVARHDEQLRRLPQR